MINCDKHFIRLAICGRYCGRVLTQVHGRCADNDGAIVRPLNNPMLTDQPAPESPTVASAQEQEAPETTASTQPVAPAHGFVALFHLLFRIAALLLYLFGSLFSLNFVLMFVIIVLLLAADFWTVKNVTGRKLVGLRWWNEIKEDGSNTWRFESAKVWNKLLCF